MTRREKLELAADPPTRLALLAWRAGSRRRTQTKFSGTGPADGGTHGFHGVEISEMTYVHNVKIA